MGPGGKKDDLRLAAWLKDAAPSGALHRWFGHDPRKRETFRTRYAAELDRKPEAWQPILEADRRGTVTLLYSARDTEHNNAVALKDCLDAARRGPRSAGGRGETAMRPR